MSVPRIGRRDRLAQLGAGDRGVDLAAHSPTRERAIVPRTDQVARFLGASDVAAQLRTLPAALDEIGGRLRRVIQRARTGQRNEAADLAALQALDQLRERAWRLFVAASARRESR